MLIVYKYQLQIANLPLICDVICILRSLSLTNRVSQSWNHVLRFVDSTNRSRFYKSGDAIGYPSIFYKSTKVKVLNLGYWQYILFCEFYAIMIVPQSKIPNGQKCTLRSFLKLDNDLSIHRTAKAISNSNQIQRIGTDIILVRQSTYDEPTTNGRFRICDLRCATIRTVKYKSHLGPEGVAICNWYL